jgi:GntR family transcriptional regulator/MocR family aminotransferase
MLTYELKKSPGVPLYEALYRAIRGDILAGVLAAGEKLPSKRALAQHLEISNITVEGAYDQLLAEGYIRSVEKVGCFVEAVQRFLRSPTAFRMRILWQNQ